MIFHIHKFGYDDRRAFSSVATVVFPSDLNRMANTQDPRDFHRVSRAMLVPSLWREPLGRVPMEALVNGIAVLAMWGIGVCRKLVSIWHVHRNLHTHRLSCTW